MSSPSTRRICTNGTNIPWLTSIPDHWGIVASKRLFGERKERALPDDEQLSATQSHGVILQKDYERLVGRKVVRILQHLDKRRHVEKDDFVISMRSFQGGLERAWCRGAIRSSYVVLRPGAHVYVPYFAQLFKSHDYIQALRATSNFIRDGQDLNFSNFCLVDLPQVPMEEQRAIAVYLDSNAALVRTFIRNQRLLIELLSEQKLAVINQAVTQGVDTSIRCKPSGVDWLGEIPEHWEVRRIRSCLTSTMAGLWGEDPTEANKSDHVICIRVADFDMIALGVSTSKLTVRAVPPHARISRALQHGDLVMEKSGGGDAQPVGRVVAFDLDQPAINSNFITRIRPNPTIVRSRFLLLVLTLLQACRRNVPSIKQTTGIQNLDERHYFSNCIGIPPLEEQDTIISWIDERLIEFRRAQEIAQREIDLIREYRTRLISDVVTGKLDVRNVAPQLGSFEVDELANIDAEEAFDDELDGVEDDDLAEEALNADD